MPDLWVPLVLVLTPSFGQKHNACAAASQFACLRHTTKGLQGSYFSPFWPLAAHFSYGFSFLASSRFDLLRALWVWGAKMPRTSVIVVVAVVVVVVAAAIAGGTQHIYGQWVSL